MNLPPSRISTLDQAVNFRAYVIHSVTAPEIAPEWRTWLEEIGFIPGEQVKVMARGLPGGDPIVVRVGSSTFALRLQEAACIHVEAADTFGVLQADPLASAAA